MSKKLFIFDTNNNLMELSKTLAQQLAKLSHKKFREREGMFLAEGLKCVGDMLPSYNLVYLIVSPEFSNNRMAWEVDPEKILIAGSDLIKKISSLQSPPEVIGVFEIPSDKNDIPKINKTGLYLLIDGVQDPGNVGTLIRTADWFGITTVFLSEDSADIFNAKTIQATMGSLARVKTVRCDLERLINLNPDMPVIGTLLEGDSIYTSSTPQSGFVVMGSEGHGISEKIKQKISLPLYIPPYNKTSHPDSLNVGVACGIVLSFIRSNR